MTSINVASFMLSTACPTSLWSTRTIFLPLPSVIVSGTGTLKRSRTNLVSLLISPAAAGMYISGIPSWFFRFA